MDSENLKTHIFNFLSKGEEYLFTYTTLGYSFEKRIGNEDKWELIATNIEDLKNDWIHFIAENQFEEYRASKDLKHPENIGKPWLRKWITKEEAKEIWPSKSSSSSKPQSQTLNDELPPSSQ